ncbi:selenide, water dikinase [Acetonema longum DSM 6540]|uniref:Selenide, water dikinase n=2 Tax=Acetonema TaxID=2373 RepID=F7NE67_9FIRM|nr:selenide, water dikinase [Acetonema longum DSM 6540]
MISDPRLLVGIETSDDAGVFALNETTALIQTVDFFTPIVDDPYTFGQIAAANSLSDVYAMGGSPLTAMNLVAFPAALLETGALAAILAGGQNKINEAGALLVGGHTVDDPEPKYGLSVTGIAHPGKVWRNAGARPQDRLILTKALGTGVLATAFRAEMFDAGWQQAIQSMMTLNKAAAETAGRFTVHACTDVTGFGFLGHLSEMATASQVTVRIHSQAVPLFPQAREAAHMGLVPGGAYANRTYFGQRGVTVQPGVPEAVADLLFDPQTSGGLLLAVPAEQAESLVKALLQQGVVYAAMVGQVETTGKGEIYVE